MKNELLSIKLPKKYISGLIEYKVGIDNIPDWPILQSNGWTFNEHLKLETFMTIEHMKYVLSEAIKDNEITEDEIKVCTVLIDNQIEKYNIWSK